MIFKATYCIIPKILHPVKLNFADLS